MKKHLTIQSELKPAKYWTEAFKLTGRRRSFKLGNVEMRYGMNYYIYSKFSKCYYLRKIREENEPNKLVKNINKGLVYLYPTEEEKEAIELEMLSVKMNYDSMNLHRMISFKIDQHIRKGDKSFGYQHKLNELTNKLKSIENE